MHSMKERFTPIADIHLDKAAVGPVVVAGWARTKRSSPNVSFIELNDGSSAKSLQIVIEKTYPDYEAAMAAIATGSSLVVEGELVPSKGRGQKYEIVAKKVELVGAVDPETYPLQKKEMSYEYLRDAANYRARTATFASVFRIRSKVSKFIHDFFERESFFYVHTPILTTSDCEGVGQTFQVTTLLQGKESPKGPLDYSKDFFAKPTFLTGSGQMEGELLALALGKVYTFGPTFRAENSNTSRHLAEFWQVEPEMAFWNLADTIQLGEDLIKYVLKRFLAECDEDRRIVIGRNAVDPTDLLTNTLEKAFVRVSYTDAVKILESSGQKFDYPVKWGIDLQSEHERFLCEQHFKAPTVVYDYPEEFKAYYMYLNDDGRTVHGADILVPGVGEIIGSSQREHRLDVLKSRIVQKGLSPESYDWYIGSRAFGTVPHSGFGLGLERLLMWLTGMGNIRDVVPFPRTPGNCDF